VNTEELNKYRIEIENKLDIKQNDDDFHVMVSMGTIGISAGSRDVLKAIQLEIEKQELDNVRVTINGGIGLDNLEPFVTVEDKTGKKFDYIQVTAEKAIRIVKEHLKNNKPILEFTIENFQKEESFSYFSKQQRVVLKHLGQVDPESMEDYIAFDGYLALTKALGQMKPDEVVEQVKKSGLRGRGGAGFPTGTKWEFVKNAKSDIKYVVCNADEGDPGAFMDRGIIEADPHRLLEGMMIAGYAVGAQKGFVYLRAEYPVAVKRLNLAIQQSRKLGLLGENSLKTGFSFDVEIRLGAGAFVCGEETALLASIEGKRGMPRPRPPFPAISGLFGKPTVINNVKTYANIREIILNGSDWYAAIGTERSKGTAIFALTGKVKNTGLVEVPMGMTIREVVFDIGGGVPDDKKMKAVQIGGPSGGCLPDQVLDTPLEYEKLTELGAMMGSGGLIVMDEDSCMVDVARFFLEFCLDESCGKCPPCRVGTVQMHKILQKITEGQGTMEDLITLEELCGTVKEMSLCGLGQTSPNPILSTLKYFRDEYISHIQEKSCPAKVCRSLLEFKINEDNCVGCSLCSRACPVTTIFKRPDAKKFYIIEDICIRCGACFDACKFDAVYKVTGPDAKIRRISTEPEEVAANG
jgi:NADH:ubiquinone oxidoreductase subunit F (NADH-binding)/NAD-dependent dihydropyrimidine dehydrogenase PreA subunit/(2Fe-2S) ferredoxin